MSRFIECIFNIGRPDDVIEKVCLVHSNFCICLTNHLIVSFSIIFRAKKDREVRVLYSLEKREKRDSKALR